MSRLKKIFTSGENFFQPPPPPPPDEHVTEDAAPGVEVTISAEGYADDTYMLTLRLLSILAMLVATSKWLKLTGREVNAKKIARLHNNELSPQEDGDPGGGPGRRADGDLARISTVGGWRANGTAKRDRAIAAAPH